MEALNSSILASEGNITSMSRVTFRWQTGCCIEQIIEVGLVDLIFDEVEYDVDRNSQLCMLVVHIIQKNESLGFVSGKPALAPKYRRLLVSIPVYFCKIGLVAIAASKIDR